MRLTRISLAATALMVTACQHDAGPFVAPVVPLAYTRFVNAVPDTFNLDFRFIDQLINSPVALLVPFRGWSVYGATQPGARHLRVFPNNGGNFPDVNVVSQVLLDTTITFEENKYYSLIFAGYTRTGLSPKAKLIVLTDNIPGQGTIGTQVAVRAVNLNPATSAVDVLVARPPGAFATTATITNVPFGGASNYVMLAADTLSLRAAATGTTASLADAVAPSGLPAVTDPAVNLQAVGGSKQAGSAFTAYFFPATAPNKQSVTFSTPGIVYQVDHHPR